MADVAHNANDYLVAPGKCSNLIDSIHPTPCLDQNSTRDTGLGRQPLIGIRQNDAVHKGVRLRRVSKVRMGVYYHDFH